MKTPVTDAEVAEYVKRLRAGGPIGKVFQAPVSECDLTEAQRAEIRQARQERKCAIKALKKAAAAGDKPVEGAANPNPIANAVKPIPVGSAVKPEPIASAAKPVSPLKPEGTKGSHGKLGRLLYLQAGRCFFCGESLPIEEASIEHLVARSHGGECVEWNEVVCHRSLNQVFGNLDLRSKFAFVIRSAGQFKCP